MNIQSWGFPMADDAIEEGGADEEEGGADEGGSGRPEEE